MKPTTTERHIGIDISKAYFDVAYREDDVVHHEQFINDKTGFRKLNKWLRQRSVTTAHFGMEATGRYGRELAFFLFEKGYTVSIINPKQIKAYGDSWLRRNKTDAADALLIADFCRERPLQHWQPPADEVAAIQDMERRIGSLKKMKTMEINRLKAGNLAKPVEASIKELIDYLEKAIFQMEESIREVVERHAKLAEDMALLTSIIGIGDITAAILIGEVKDITFFDSPSALAAYAGVTSRLHQSGDTVRKKPQMSRVGNARLRTALYYPTMSAMQNNPAIKALVERLKEKGKPGKVILIAAMRKLLHIIYGVWTSRSPFDPAYEQRFATATS